MFYDDSEASGEHIYLKNISSAFISISNNILSIFWIHNCYKMAMQLLVTYSVNKKKLRIFLCYCGDKGKRSISIHFISH